MNAMSLLQKCGIGKKLRCALSMNCPQNPLGFEQVELICRRTSVLRGEIQRIKTSQDRSKSISLRKANKRALGSENFFILGQKICRALLMTLSPPAYHHHPQRVR